MKLNVLVCRQTVNFSFRDMFTGHYKKKKKIGVLRRLNMPSREKKDENYLGAGKEVKRIVVVCDLFYYHEYCCPKNQWLR